MPKVKVYDFTERDVLVAGWENNPDIEISYAFIAYDGRDEYSLYGVRVVRYTNPVPFNEKEEPLTEVEKDAILFCNVEDASTLRKWFPNNTVVVPDYSTLTTAESSPIKKVEGVIEFR